MAGHDTETTLGRIEEVAARHAPFVTAFSSLGYDTTGYGYGARDSDGVPLLQSGISKLARH